MPQRTQYAQQACGGVFSLRVRPTVRLGDPLPFWLDQAALRIGSASSRPTITLAISAFLADASGSASKAAIVGEIGVFGGGGFGLTLGPKRLSENVTAGPHMLRATLRLISGPPTGNPSDKTLPGSTPIALQHAFTLLPASQPSVTAIANPKLADAIRSGIKLDPRSRSFSLVTATALPVAVSFNIYALIGGKESLLGACAFPPKTIARSWGFDTASVFAPLFPASQPATTAATKKVTLILRSDPAPAINSMDIFDYWDGSLEFKDVPIQPY